MAGTPQRELSPGRQRGWCRQLRNIAGDTLLHDGAKRGQRGTDVADTRVLRLHRESVRGAMHLRADILHALWHIGSDVRGAGRKNVGVCDSRGGGVMSKWVLRRAPPA